MGDEIESLVDGWPEPVVGGSFLELSRVGFIEASVFEWEPPALFDVVFFSFSPLV
ncbi:MAG: hypothetical protein JOY80_01835 [Candidatus Dormibacteraeota bacterium]|nr:hypothetical protein [Candidatus Dormibacteraeota bacterium]